MFIIVCVCTHMWRMFKLVYECVIIKILLDTNYIFECHLGSFQVREASMHLCLPYFTNFHLFSPCRTYHMLVLQKKMYIIIIIIITVCLIMDPRPVHMHIL